MARPASLNVPRLRTNPQSAGYGLRDAVGGFLDAREAVRHSGRLDRQLQLQKERGDREQTMLDQAGERIALEGRRVGVLEAENSRAERQFTETMADIRQDRADKEQYEELMPGIREVYNSALRAGASNKEAVGAGVDFIVDAGGGEYAVNTYLEDMNDELTVDRLAAWAEQTRQAADTGAAQEKHIGATTEGVQADTALKTGTLDANVRRAGAQADAAVADADVAAGTVGSRIRESDNTATLRGAQARLTAQQGATEAALRPGRVEQQGAEARRLDASTRVLDQQALTEAEMRPENKALRRAQTDLTAANAASVAQTTEQSADLHPLNIAAKELEIVTNRFNLSRDRFADTMNRDLLNRTQQYEKSAVALNGEFQKGNITWDQLHDGMLQAGMESQTLALLEDAMQKNITTRDLIMEQMRFTAGVMGNMLEAPGPIARNTIMLEYLNSVKNDGNAMEVVRNLWGIDDETMQSGIYVLEVLKSAASGPPPVDSQRARAWIEYYNERFTTEGLAQTAADATIVLDALTREERRVMDRETETEAVDEQGNVTTTKTTEKNVPVERPRQEGDTLDLGVQ